MKSKKVISLLVGICGIISGILVIVFAVIDRPFSTILWILFSASCFANGWINFTNWKKKVREISVSSIK